MSTTELVPSARPEVLLPADPEQVRAAMEAYVATTKAALSPSDWQGDPDQPGSFIRKSGWQKIAKAYSLSTQIVSEQIDRDIDGGPLRAAAVVRAIGPNGQTREATGYCSREERRFATAGGREKIEHDLRATAMTRAENRAISNLVGVGAVSAEERDHAAEPQAVVIPDWAKPIGPEDDFGTALVRLAGYSGVSHDEAEQLALRLGDATYKQCDGAIPVCVSTFVRRLLFLCQVPTDAPADPAQEETR